MIQRGASTRPPSGGYRTITGAICGNTASTASGASMGSEPATRSCASFLSSIRSGSRRYRFSSATTCDKGVSRNTRRPRCQAVMAATFSWCGAASGSPCA
ncbi:hypothetical protein G6F59_016289 [Rhizopus arrhizus]|nr:hypothetical protein G6F59_016289 [Rhizopus arrhizus]